MRELALVTFKIVDESARFQPEEVQGLYTPDFTDSTAAVNMQRLERGNQTGQAGVVEQTSDGDLQFAPRDEMSLVRVEPCNPDSALGNALLADEKQVVGQFLTKLAAAGEKLLVTDNDERSQLHTLSKTLGGDGVERTDTVQFYAVFDLSAHGEEVSITLEGVLRLDKIDMAIDEAIFLS